MHINLITAIRFQVVGSEAAQVILGEYPLRLQVNDTLVGQTQEDISCLGVDRDQGLLHAQRINDGR
jgi:hypothetical protein